MRFHFCDQVVLDENGLRRTTDGYLAGYGRVARTGIQRYKGHEVGKPDQEWVNVYRPAEQVFAADAMHSAAHRPTTLNHPPEMVNSRNWKKYATGYTGDEVIRDGDHVRVPIVLMDEAAIDAYEKGGIREMSGGYSTDLKWEPGKTTDGQTYDAVQTAIRWNHLAQVPNARGGKTLHFGDALSRNCPKCGNPVSVHNSTCTTCGHEIGPGKVPKATDANVEGRMCENCGEDLPDDADQCPACFTPVDADIIQEDDMFEDAAFYDREFTAEKRKTLAKSGAAMKGGGFPIETVGDLKNAIQSIGRAKNPAATKAHIIKRARALGATKELPEDWKTTDADLFGRTEGTRNMTAIVLVDGAEIKVADELSAQVITKHITSLSRQLADAKKDAGKAAEKEQEAEEELREQKDAMKKACDAKDGEIAVLKKQVTDAAVTPEKLDTMVKDRLAVIDKASKVLDPKKFAFDGKSNADIRRAAVALKLTDAVAKDMSDAAIEGAFAALTIEAKGSGVTRLGDAISNGQRQLDQLHRPGYAQDGSMTMEDAMADRAKAFDERMKNLSDAWKQPAASA